MKVFDNSVRNTLIPRSMKESSDFVHDVAVPYRIKSSALGLEFPDWSGHKSRKAKMTLTEMHRYCERVMHYAKNTPGYKETRLKHRCYAEFVL